MPRKLWTIVFATLTLLAFGCSRSEVTTQATAPTASATLAATLPSSSSSKAQTRETSGPTAPAVISEDYEPPQVQEFTPFGATRVVVPVVTTKSATEGDNAEPTLRLLGFVNARGLKSLLSDDGALKVLSFNTENGRILAVEAPDVMVKQNGAEFQLTLFDEGGFHLPEAILSQDGFGVDGFPHGHEDALPGLPRFGENDQVHELPGFEKNGDQLPGIPGLPGFADEQAGEGIPGLPTSNLPGVPGFGGPEEIGVPPLPGFGNGEDNELPGVDGGEFPGLNGIGVPDFPGFDQETEGGLPGLPARAFPQEVEAADDSASAAE
jgi:hypothetical protein